MLFDGYPGGVNGTNTALIYGDYYFTEALLRLQNVLDGQPGWLLYSPTIPEPSTWAMTLIGFVGLGYGADRRARSGRAALAALPCRCAAPVGQPRRLISGCFRCPVTATRFRASASAALVRVEIIFLSAWAITAMMPTTSSLASGMSAATNRTPAFWSPSRKCASRAQPVELGDQERRRR